MTGALLRRLTGFLRDCSAVTAAEFALVVPFFIVLVFGTINTSLAVAAVTQIHYAAERSARCLSVDVGGNCTAGNIGTYAQRWYNGPGVSNMTFLASQETCGNQVVGSADFAILTGIESTAVTISATACYPVI